MITYRSIGNCFKYWFSFLHTQLPLLQQQGWDIRIDPDFYYRQKQQTADFSAEFEQTEQDYFSLSMQIEIDGTSMPLFPII